MNFGKVAVLMGGESGERAISLQSGEAVLASLQRSGVEAHGIDARRPFLCELAAQDFARAFIALHGELGEDGVVQGGLELIDLPYTGSAVCASALAMDKCMSKRVWQGMGLPTPDFAELHSAEDLQPAAARLGLPLAVKPAVGGSSLGISKVAQPDELLPAWQAARRCHRRVLAERWVDGAEYTAAILHRRVLPLVRLETPRAFYDYTAKYESEHTRYLCPCGLPEQREQELAALALAAFHALGGYGWGRIDLRLDVQGAPWLLEFNTVPGMTRHSLVPRAADHAGLDFDALTLAILRTSMRATETPS